MPNSHHPTGRDATKQFRRVGKGGSVAEWSAFWTEAQKGPGWNRSRDAVE